MTLGWSKMHQSWSKLVLLTLYNIQFGPKLAHVGPKMASTWLMFALIWLILAKVGSKLSCAKLPPKLANVGLSWLQVGPGPGWLRMAPSWLSKTMKQLNSGAVRQDRQADSRTVKQSDI